MKNKEKYAEEILKAFVESSVCGFKKKYVFRADCCARNIGCTKCTEITRDWLDAECVEPRIDWSKVPPGTPVIAWDNDGIKDHAPVREFVIYYPGAETRKFVTCDAGYKFHEVSRATTSSWKHCELAPGVDTTPYLLKEDADAKDGI